VVTEPGTAAVLIAVISAVTTITRAWLRARRGRAMNELRAGHVYRLPPRCQIRDLGGPWVAVDAGGQAASRDGLPDDLR
jgi:hypothetical protein